jgi:Fe2+ transport system protein FeoA
MGLCEEQKIRLIAKNGNYICQVCNTRLGISSRVAERIMVESIPPHRKNSTIAGDS